LENAGEQNRQMNNDKAAQQQFVFEGDELVSVMEALLFASGDALDIKEIAKALSIHPDAAQAAVERLASQYDYHRRGLSVVRFGQKVQLATRREYGAVIEKLFFSGGRQSLSQSALETLAIIAYRQPVTRLDVEMIRGVRCEYAVASLAGKGLIHEVGRKDTLGRPILYGTTDAFLRHFAIESLDDLPSLDQFALLAEGKAQVPADEFEALERSMEASDEGGSGEDAPEAKITEAL
jgi:segregation and condensation protein B